MTKRDPDLVWAARYLAYMFFIVLPLGVIIAVVTLNAGLLFVVFFLLIFLPFYSEVWKALKIWWSYLLNKEKEE